MFNPLDDYYGMSPIQASSVDIDQHNLANKHNVNLLSVLKTKLFTIAPTSQPREDAASNAVLAEELSCITFSFKSNSLRNFSTLFTGSLFNNDIFNF